MGVGVDVTGRGVGDGGEVGEAGRGVDVTRVRRLARVGVSRSALLQAVIKTLNRTSAIKGRELVCVLMKRTSDQAIGLKGKGDQSGV
jgi:hypothetical protein